MRIGIIGIEGNMGKRYKTIVEHIGGYEVCGYDIGYTEAQYDYCLDSDKIIIATPTKFHYRDLLRTIQNSNAVAILCEKPISKDLDELETLKEMASVYNKNIYMVNQYRFLFNDEYKGLDDPDCYSYYNYFKTGNDGLSWDCIQIIYLSTTPNITIANDSPIWTCVINNTVLNIKDMDSAYIKMIYSFLTDKKNLWDINDATRATRGVIEYDKKNKKVSDRDSSKIE